MNGLDPSEVRIALAQAARRTKLLHALHAFPDKHGCIDASSVAPRIKLNQSYAIRCLDALAFHSVCTALGFFGVIQVPV